MYQVLSVVIFPISYLSVHSLTNIPDPSLSSLQNVAKLSKKAACSEAAGRVTRGGLRYPGIKGSGCISAERRQESTEIPDCCLTCGSEKSYHVESDCGPQQRRDLGRTGLGTWQRR